MEELKIKDAKGQAINISKSRPYLLEKVESIGFGSNISTMNGAFDGVNVTGLNIKEKVVTIQGSIVGVDKRRMQQEQLYSC